MKSLFSFCVLNLLLLMSLNSFAQQDKSKRPSPPATVTQKVGGLQFLLITASLQ